MKNVITIAVCCVMFFTLNKLANAQINPNGGFEEGDPGVYTGTGLAGWDFQTGGTAEATFEVVTDEVHTGAQALKVTIDAIGTNAWEPQVINTSFPVESATTYHISAWVKTDIEGMFASFTMGSLAPNYFEWGRQGSVPLTLEWQQVTFEATTRDPETEPSGGIPIHLGVAENATVLPASVYLDDIEVTIPGVSGVSTNNGSAPARYFLSQNYPNPFNPSTKVSFSIPEQNNVRIVMVNMLGETVKEVVNQNFEAGSHEVTIDGSNLASGIYFYKLQAGSFTAIKKMVLMK